MIVHIGRYFFTNRCFVALPIGILIKILLIKILSSISDDVMDEDFVIAEGKYFLKKRKRNLFRIKLKIFIGN